MSGPLAGIRELEFSQVIAAPFAGQFLADFGADVIKIEPPEGESWRLQASFAPGESKSFQALNRGKRAMTLRLDNPAAQAIVHALMPTIDVVLINYRPDVPRKFNIDYTTLAALRGDLIYADLTAFGRRGPWALQPGYDGVVQAVSGLMAGEGKLRDDGSPATIVASAIADYGTGMVLADAIITALYHRARTGEGQFIECSLLATALNLQGVQVMEHATADSRRNGVRTLRRQRASEGAPYAELVRLRDTATQSAGDVYARAYLAVDGAFVVAADTAAHRAALRTLWVGQWDIELPAEAEPGYDSDDPVLRARCAAAAVHIEQCYATRHVDECVLALRALGVPAAVVQFGEEMGRDPQVLGNGFMVDMVHEVTGPQTALRPALTFSAGVPGPLRASPPVGRDTDAVLREIGYSDSRIAELRRAGGVVNAVVQNVNALVPNVSAVVPNVSGSDVNPAVIKAAVLDSSAGG